jgi:hypothetical protein
MDHDEHLAIHDELFRNLTSLHLKMDARMDELKSILDRVIDNLEVVTELLQRQRRDDSNGV